MNFILAVLSFLLNSAISLFIFNSILIAVASTGSEPKLASIRLRVVSDMLIFSASKSAMAPADASWLL